MIRSKLQDLFLPAIVIVAVFALTIAVSDIEAAPQELVTQIEGPRPLSPAPGDLPGEGDWTFDVPCDGSSFMDANGNYLFLMSYSDFLIPKHSQLYVDLNARIPLRLDLLNLEVDLLDQCLPGCIIGDSKDYFRETASDYENQYCTLLADYDGLNFQQTLQKIDALIADFENRPAVDDEGFCEWWAAWTARVVDVKAELVEAGRKISSLSNGSQLLLMQINNLTAALRNHSCLPEAKPF